MTAPRSGSRFLLPRSVILLLSIGALPFSTGCRKEGARLRAFSAPPLSSGIALTPREEATATTLASGEVVVLGGFGAGGEATPEAELVGVAGGVRSLPPLPQGRARHAAVAVEGGARVAVLGGVSGSRQSPTPLASTLLHDPAAAAGAVTPGPDLPAPLSESRAVFWDGGTPADPSDDAVFLVGGRDGAGAASPFVVRWQLWPAPGSATLFATLSVPRAGHTATLCLDPAGLPRIYVIGGENGAGALATSDVIDPATGSVAAGPDLPRARTRAAAAPVGGCAAILVAGGLGSGGSPRGDADLLFLSAPGPETFTPLGSFGPASFDLLVLPQADGSAVVLGGFTGMSGGAPASPSREAALFAFEPAGGGGRFIDLPDFDLASGAGAPAGAVRPGRALGAEGTGSVVVLAGGRGSGGELRAGRAFNPYNAAAAAAHDLKAQVGLPRAMAALAVVGILGVIERTREYGVGRRRDIGLETIDDPARGAVVSGRIGELEVELELDGGLIHGKAAGREFAVFTGGDDLSGDGLTLDLRVAPDDSIQGRYFLSWKRNSILVQLSELYPDGRFEGRIGSPLRNVAIEIEDGGARINSHRSFLDTRGLDLSGSR